MSPQKKERVVVSPPVLWRLVLNLAAEAVRSDTLCKLPRIGELTEEGVVKLCTGDQEVAPVPAEVLSPLKVK